MKICYCIYPTYSFEAKIKIEYTVYVLTYIKHDFRKWAFKF